jgi:multicomponent Na+:H+ antiporter subunit F
VLKVEIHPRWRHHPTQANPAADSEALCMAEFYQGFILFLLLNIAAGLWRVFRGPARADRILAAQLFGTMGVAILVVLAEAQNIPALRDVALVFVLLAIVATAAFVKAFRTGGQG